VKVGISPKITTVCNPVVDETIASFPLPPMCNRTHRHVTDQINSDMQTCNKKVYFLVNSFCQLQDGAEIKKVKHFPADTS
jgi:hypothetical protein